MSVDELVARYKALDAEVDSLLVRQDQAAEQDKAAINAALDTCYDGMERVCGAILDTLLGPSEAQCGQGNSGRPAG